MIYGSPVDVLDLEPFLNSLNKGEDKIAVGNDANGNKITLLGVSAEYSMEHGECTALVAGLPVSYIQDALFLDEEELSYYPPGRNLCDSERRCVPGKLLRKTPVHI